ncbi:hypothetical protein [Halopseudomonas xinjiangensis]|nr:hypothetical protein [Halopseudomonas xinjiangensis]
MLVDSRLDELVEQAIGALPADEVLGLRHESTGDLHCQAVLYFSPGLPAWATSLGARACSPPARRGLSAVVGDERILAGLD